jgi:hypothetical protein
MSLRAMGRDVVVTAGWPRRTFAVGKLTRRSAEILLAEARQAPRAPFLLKAVVSGPRGSQPGAELCAVPSSEVFETIH